MRSYNGWPASPSLKTRVIEPVVGVKLRIADNQNLADVFTYLVQQFHKRVDDVTKPHPADDWGFAFRPNVNDPNSLSNHASGTAIDLDATEHPNGVATSRTFTPGQIAEVHEILEELEGTIRWGGDYTNTPDAMHFEVLRGPGSLRKVAKKIRKIQNPPKINKETRGTQVDRALRNLKKAKAHGKRKKLIDRATSVLEKIKPW